jgi:subtilisin family serine protease
MSVWMPDDGTTCGGNPPIDCAGAVENNVQHVVAANIPVVVSAQNQDNGDCNTSPARLGYGNEQAYPAPYRTITVGGTMYGARQADGTYPDARWTCSGPDCIEPGSNFGRCVSIYAPAWDIHSAHTVGFGAYREAVRSGTSWSAPIVAGLVARILEQNPALTAHEVWLKLQNDANRAAVDFDPSPGVFNNLLVYLSHLE